VTIRHALHHAAFQLEEAKIPSAQLDSELIMAYVAGRNRAWVLAHDDTELDETQLDIFHSLVSRRLAREPVVHLTGTREFYGLDFEITPDVLTPRVETVQMVEWAIKYAPQAGRLIDIGTGSGAIAIAIAKHRPELHITATDISDRELAVARRNAAKHGVAIDFVVSDLWSQIPSSDIQRATRAQRFDTIVTNLPYLADDADLMPEVKREPAVALFGGPDGLNLYRRFLAGVPAHLAPGGYLFTECDPWQHEGLIKSATKVGLNPVEQGYFILGFEFAN
jgi:release factor glutamine methyltransferase